MEIKKIVEEFDLGNGKIKKEKYQIVAQVGFILMKDGFYYGKSVTTDSTDGWREIKEES